MMSDDSVIPAVTLSEYSPLQRDSVGRAWPQIGERLELKTPLLITELLAHYREPHLSVRVYLAVIARDDELETGEIERAAPRVYRELWVSSPRQAEQLLKRRSDAVSLWAQVAPERCPPNPCAFERVGQWACLIAPAPEGEPVAPPQDEQQTERPQRPPRWARRDTGDELKSPQEESVIALSGKQSAQRVSSVVERLTPILHLLEELHSAGYALGGFAPKSLCVSGGRCVPRWALDLHSCADQLGLEMREQLTYLGYSPPEAYGHYSALPSAASDIFSAGMWLYYAVTSSPLLHEARRPHKRLPAPRVYNASIAPELEAVIQRATSPVPERRYSATRAFSEALARAVESSSKRAEPAGGSVAVEVAHEIHVGLLKGHYNPINQDDIFLAYQPESERGLFVVTDGVSISEYGSGDVASGYVRSAAQAAWSELIAGPSLPEEEETLSELSLLDLQRSAARPSTALITDMLNEANRSIGEHVMEEQGVFHGPPEGIMAATAVVVFMEGDQALLSSMGDSRIYLIRDGHLSSLMVDDDLATHLMQMGQTPSQAYQAPSSAALVNCVGEFKKDHEGRLEAVPVQPQLASLRVLPHDTIVLCSDGIPDYGGFDEEDAERKILNLVESAFSAPKAAFDLVTLANQGGGGDNISCIVLRFREREGDA